MELVQVGLSKTEVRVITQALVYLHKNKKFTLQGLEYTTGPVGDKRVIERWKKELREETKELELTIADLEVQTADFMAE
jgi:hypothetical protein